MFVMQQPYLQIIKTDTGHEGNNIIWPQFDYLCIINEIAECQGMLIGGFFYFTSIRFAR